MPLIAKTISKRNVCPLVRKFKMDGVTHIVVCSATVPGYCVTDNPVSPRYLFTMKPTLKRNFESGFRREFVLPGLPVLWLVTPTEVSCRPCVIPFKKLHDANSRLRHRFHFTDSFVKQKCFGGDPTNALATIQCTLCISLQMIHQDRTAMLLRSGVSASALLDLYKFDVFKSRKRSSHVPDSAC